MFEVHQLDRGLEEDRWLWASGHWVSLQVRLSLPKPAWDPGGLVPFHGIRGDSPSHVATCPVIRVRPAGGRGVRDLDGGLGGRKPSYRQGGDRPEEILHTVAKLGVPFQRGQPDKDLRRLRFSWWHFLRLLLEVPQRDPVQLWLLRLRLNIHV